MINRRWIKGCYTDFGKSWMFHFYTSSTAQGGGGSFKIGKPIGEMLPVVSHRWQSKKQWWMKVTNRLHDCLGFNVNERNFANWVGRNLESYWKAVQRARGCCRCDCERTLIFVRLTLGDCCSNHWDALWWEKAASQKQVTNCLTDGTD